MFGTSPKQCLFSGSEPNMDFQLSTSYLDLSLHILRLSIVWVFTNIDTIFYLFKPNRESDFLKELLADFKGVLISDFYPGYDAVIPIVIIKVQRTFCNLQWLMPRE